MTTVVFDRRYDCLTCESADLGLFADLDNRTWTCRVCGQPVQILVQGKDGHSFLVERHPARTLQPNDYVALEQDPSKIHRVLTSAPAMGKGKLWYITLEGHSGQRVEPERYYNRIP